MNIFPFSEGTNFINLYYICMMKYFFVIAFFLLSVTSASAQVLNGRFDKFTGDIPNDWTVSPDTKSRQLKDSSGNPFVEISIPFNSPDGYSVIMLTNATPEHPYGALLDPKVKKLTFRYLLTNLVLSNIARVSYRLRDHTGYLYDVGQQVIRPTAYWDSAEFDIVTKHRDPTGQNYIELRFSSLAPGSPNGQPNYVISIFHLDDVVLDTNASLAVSKLTPTTNSLLITPNPASSQTRIIRNLQNAEPLTTMIYDITGVLVKRIHSSEDNTSGVIVETSDLPNGVYCVRSIVGNSVLSQKLVVAH